MKDNFHAQPLTNAIASNSGPPLDLVDIRNSLTSLIWRTAGVRRNQQALAEAASSIDGWCGYVLGRQFADAAGWELQNMLIVARIVLGAAMAREESRGVHLRTDFPEVDDRRWQRHVSFRREKTG